MRVALIDPSLFTLPYDAALAGGLAALGHTVTLHGRRPGPDDGDADGVRIAGDFYPVAESGLGRRLPRPARLAVKAVDHMVSAARLLHRLRRDPPDIIHVQWLPLPVVDGRLLPAFGRVGPLVLTVHDTNPFNGDPTSRVQRHGFARCLAEFDRLIVHTAQGRARLADMGFGDRTVVIPHGLLGAPSVPATGRADGPVTLLLFGKIKPYKGADLLIEAFAHLPEALRAGARVRIVGKPYMDLAPLMARAASLGVGGQVAFEPEFVADSDVPALFGPSVVAVFPYREIEASGVLAMAMAHGCPIVASAIGSFAETLRDGVHGHLVPPDDVGALSAALAHILADSAFRESASAQVRHLAGGVPRWTDIARSTESVYRAAGLAAGLRRAGRFSPGGHVYHAG